MGWQIRYNLHISKLSIQAHCPQHSRHSGRGSTNIHKLRVAVFAGPNYFAFLHWSWMNRVSTSGESLQMSEWCAHTSLPCLVVRLMINAKVWFLWSEHSEASAIANTTQTPPRHEDTIKRYHQEIPRDHGETWWNHKGQTRPKHKNQDTTKAPQTPQRQHLGTWWHLSKHLDAKLPNQAAKSDPSTKNPNTNAKGKHHLQIPSRHN